MRHSPQLVCFDSSKMRARGSKNPKAGNPAWVKGMKSPNPKGRVPVGMSFKDRCQAVAGNGEKLAWLYGCLGGIAPLDAVETSFGSSGLAFSIRIKQLMQKATVRDRIFCLARLEDRAFGLMTQQIEHSGEVSNLPVRVVHEYQPASS